MAEQTHHNFANKERWHSKLEGVSRLTSEENTDLLQKYDLTHSERRQLPIEVCLLPNQAQMFNAGIMPNNRSRLAYQSLNEAQGGPWDSQHQVWPKSQDSTFRLTMGHSTMLNFGKSAKGVGVAVRKTAGLNLG